MKVQTPPKVQSLSAIREKYPDREQEYFEYFSPVDKKGRYLHYDQLRFRVGDLDPSLVWSIVKFVRSRQQHFVLNLGEPPQACSFWLTPLIQKAISETDRNTTAASLDWMLSQIGEQSHFQYLLNDLTEDESISSSQLEGAATTTQVAKDLLKKERKPTTEGERMILGNYRMMLCAWENRNEKLSLELIWELHRTGVEGIDDDHYQPGVFRKSDDVQVVDNEQNILHTPPPAKGLRSRIKEIVEWANTDHSNLNDLSYLHPLIKAIVLHFCIGYEHPFRDGNGRVARALFYWYLFHNGFAAFRYIAISHYLKKGAVKYGKSYLYSETDGMDLTYFIEHQSSVIVRAIENFKQVHQKTAQEIEDFNKWLWSSGLYNKLNEKQKTVFQVAKSGIASAFTVRNVEKNLGCAYNTAAAVLNGLVGLKLFSKRKEGKVWVYYMEDKEKIVKNWS